MFRVTRRVHFCYGHRLLGHAGKCRHLHGHNAVAEVAFRRSGLDRLGMVLDFGAIKEALQGWVDSEFDHKMLLNSRDPMAKALKGLGEPVTTFRGNPTAENIAKRIFDFAKSRRLPVDGVRVWESRDTCAEYGR